MSRPSLLWSWLLALMAGAVHGCVRVQRGARGRWATGAGSAAVAQRVENVTPRTSAANPARPLRAP